MTFLPGRNAAVRLEILASKWSAELAAALPRRWRDPCGLRRWIIIENDTWTGDPKDLKRRPVAFAVPQEDFLIRHIEIPLASSFQTSNVMRFEATRHIPLPPDKACIDFRIVDQDVVSSRTTVELAIIRREVVEAAFQRAKASGIRIEAVCLPTGRGAWLARRPVGLNWHEKWFSLRHCRRYLDAILPVLLCFIWVSAAQNWAARIAADRESAEITARNQAEGIGPLRSQLLALNDTLDYLARTRERASAANVSEEVARLLPDQAWLQELDIEDQTVRLLGTAQNATELLRNFSSSSLVSNPRFEAPLTEAVGVPGDQFDILLNRR